MDPPPPPPATNPELPVLAEQVWTSGDALELQVRVGVHALRRIDGATILDWSLTPLRGVSLQVGDPVPTTLDLGLAQPGDELPRIYLLDPRAGVVHRPLASAADPERCVCTPLSTAQRRLRVGHTSLLQVAFPELPASSTSIEVSIASVPPFWTVPISPAGRIPAADRPTQLARPEPDRLVDAAPVAGGFSDMFRFGPDQQIFRIQANRLLAGRTSTALEWTVWSVTGGAGLDAASGPPFAERAAAGEAAADPMMASGPTLVAATEQGERVLRARLMTSDGSGTGTVECLCSSLRGWTSALRRPDSPATVVTSYPALPTDTRRVHVRIAGVGVIPAAVTPVPDVGSRAGQTRPWSRATWDPGDLSSGPGWTSDDWPTPVPPADELPDRPREPSALVR